MDALTPMVAVDPRTAETAKTSLLTPGNHPKFAGIKSDDPLGKLNFLSLMLALFCGTASLPHILIRYYTVKDAAAARKSTIVGIATIGFFYVLTLYIGLGAMTSGALDPTDSNLAAPLLARTFGEWLFACISAVAFTTVLGTVSGLILASAGAVSHDLMTHGLGIEMDEAKQVRVAKIASVVVGAVAIGLGIVFQGLNVGYLVGWAFSVAASANLPALVCILFWRGTTAAGVVAGVTVGMVSSLAWILLSSDTFEAVYGLDPADALTPFTQPGIVTIPLGFAALVLGEFGDAETKVSPKRELREYVLDHGTRIPSACASGCRRTRSRSLRSGLISLRLGRFFLFRGRFAVGLRRVGFFRGFGRLLGGLLGLGDGGLFFGLLFADGGDELLLRHPAAAGDFEFLRPVVEFLAGGDVEGVRQAAGVRLRLLRLAALRAAEVDDRAGGDRLGPVRRFAGVHRVVADPVVEFLVRGGPDVLGRDHRGDRGRARGGRAHG